MSERTVKGPPLKSEFTVVDSTGAAGGVTASSTSVVVSFCSARGIITLVAFEELLLRGALDNSDGAVVFAACNHDDVDIAIAKTPIATKCPKFRNHKVANSFGAPG